ncbi:MAG: hypothetical protein QF464_08865 [Myxococcota bacterium]|jgi:hypothetical protein|nr:hypothetical protein [Myxococcota bacterium]
MIRALILALVTLLATPGLAFAQSTLSTDVRGALDKLKAEPTVRDVQEAALQYFRVNQGQIDSMRSRARIKALAPVLEVSGGYTKSELDDISTNAAEGFSTFSDPWVVRGSGGMGWNIRAKMTLNLPRLVFNPEELDVASLAGLVEGILKESTRLYYMRRRLQVDMVLKPPTDQATLLSKQLRIEELTAMLDAMTGGWYQTALDVTTGKRSRTEARAPIGTTPTDTTISLPRALPTRGKRLTPAAAGR